MGLLTIKEFADKYGVDYSMVSVLKDDLETETFGKRVLVKDVAANRIHFNKSRAPLVKDVLKCHEQGMSIDAMADLLELHEGIVYCIVNKFIK